MTTVYVALGGNVGDTETIFRDAIMELKRLGTEFQVSRFHTTKPVSDIPQRDFLNAVSTFKTDLTPFELLAKLQEIETKLGKVPKPKEAPRKIDLDLIFYGLETLDEPGLKVPHHRFQERLFVLEPLRELTDKVGEWDIDKLVKELHEDN